MLGNVDDPHRFSRPVEETADEALGVWQCELPDETLTWNDAVYDIFELPRGLRVHRYEALGFYSEKSRALLEQVRSAAILKGTGFTFDAEITTALGKSRLVRIVASVVYENGGPVRIFGTKQDLTHVALKKTG